VAPLLLVETGPQQQTRRTTDRMESATICGSLKLGILAYMYLGLLLLDTLSSDPALLPRRQTPDCYKEPALHTMRELAITKHQRYQFQFMHREMYMTYGTTVILQGGNINCLHCFDVVAIIRPVNIE